MSDLLRDVLAYARSLEVQPPRPARMEVGRAVLAWLQERTSPPEDAPFARDPADALLGIPIVCTLANPLAWRFVDADGEEIDSGELRPVTTTEAS